MSALRCEVRGLNERLAPRLAECVLGDRPIWTVQGPLGGRPLSDKALDLLDLAGAIYRAESQIKRRISDPAVEWIVTAPVRDAKFWAQTGGPLLERALSFMNRARWSWTFTERADAPAFVRPEPDTRVVKDVLLFSGGMDSLCGAGVHPTPKAEVQLASFYHAQAALQAELGKELGYQPPARWRLTGHRGKEGMNLVRSFMFLCLGAIVAESYGASSLYQYENGVLGAAIPPAGNFIPTRHAHPGTHARIQALFKAVFDRELQILNPFLSLTKRETGVKLAEAIGGKKAEELLRRTETCWFNVQPKVGSVPKSPWQPCGVCTPCIVRRTARPDEAAPGAWTSWKGYAFDLTEEKWRDHPKLGLSFRAYLELVDIATSEKDDAALVGQLAPEARALIGVDGGPSATEVAALLRRFAAEFCEAFNIKPRKPDAVG